MARSAFDLQEPAVRFLSLRILANFKPAAEVSSRQGIGIGFDFFRRPRSNDFSAVHAGSRAHVHNVVGSSDGVLVMLYNNHTVAKISQRFQRVNQLIVITLMETDRRLVEYINNSAQSQTDLTGQSNSLRFTAGKCVCPSIQGEIAQPHIN